MKTDVLKKAKLNYVSTDEAGYHRKRWGRGFTYLDENGDTIKDKSLREWIESLRIPPAWEDVWICSDPQGHILATGRDSENRKQYIYHPDWQQQTNEAKFDQLAEFGKCLPAIRQQTEANLRKRSLTREKVLAVMVCLLEKTLIRIGGEFYTQHNDSYGLTTLQDKHVAISGKRITFEFTGKSGQDHEIDLTDKRLASVVRICRDIPGYRLFQYYDEAGDRRTIESGDVNDYLRNITGQDFTSKHFRTWGASAYMIEALSKLPPPETEREAEKAIVQAIKEVARKLGNTPAVCRKYYVHPAVVESYQKQTLNTVFEDENTTDAPETLTIWEAALLRLISR